MRLIDVDLRILANDVIRVEGRSRNVMLFVLVVPLDALNAQEGEAEYDSQQKEYDQQFALSHLSRAYSQRHGQAAADQNDGIDRSPLEAQTAAAGSELVEVVQAVNQVGAEHAAKKHDFRTQEQP